MRVLTLWQPWGSLIDLGQKRIETRGLATSYRGDLLISAAKTWNRALDAQVSEPAFITALTVRGAPYHDAGPAPAVVVAPAGTFELPRGQALCLVHLSDCVPVEEVRDRLSPQELAFGNYDDGRFAWILTSLRRLVKPVPWVGAQGLRTVPERTATILQLMTVPTCRACGCTDAQGCGGGCAWVRDDLCSACLALPAAV
jgi:activating signal cointegrator 1